MDTSKREYTYGAKYICHVPMNFNESLQYLAQIPENIDVDEGTWYKNASVMYQAFNMKDLLEDIFKDHKFDLNDKHVEAWEFIQGEMNK